MSMKPFRIYFTRVPNTGTKALSGLRTPPRQVPGHAQGLARRVGGVIGPATLSAEACFSG